VTLPVSSQAATGWPPTWLGHPSGVLGSPAGGVLGIGDPWVSVR
jgi:hypothetical protein